MAPNSVYAAFWAYDRLYPGKDAWPLAEMWCNNRYAVASAEYTVSQTIALAAATYAYLCSSAKHTSPNRSPSLRISTAEAAYRTNQLVSLRAEAADPDGWIQRVDYFADQRFIGRTTVPPFTLSWQPGRIGEYRVEAEVHDNRGAKASSEPITVVVSGGVADRRSKD